MLPLVLFILISFLSKPAKAPFVINGRHWFFIDIYAISIFLPAMSGQPRRWFLNAQVNLPLVDLGQPPLSRHRVRQLPLLFLTILINVAMLALNRPAPLT